jgi:hypothetical protein
MVLDAGETCEFVGNSKVLKYSCRTETREYNSDRYLGGC